MKEKLILLTVLVSLGVVCAQAETKKDTTAAYATATVISVEKHEAPSNYIDTPTDAPLRADEYSYDIGIRFDCQVYVGRYDSAVDDLPSAFTLAHPVRLRLEKHSMYISLPSGDRDVKMGVVSHKRVKDPGCNAGS